ncbi:CAMK/CAMKL/KIN4 protein kinase [Nannizzia gypsea CBS 118893]|uniref:non-specific serine/threonine protein kinase n=1 Tax=Arthroderma gypseum (strain ATCC MYA-4604 / CBS 118893) TaxID=535722 RepID=E4V1P7_ARTGP|nr:CAMK/CAMKL/KIN4 protein kinase [Nannizzia gypsea CBS 118893]EFR03962.1 CAMK/CAMKL/KIN4 protein kinase [Nannizzia gypsea CBS 118893]
MSSSLQASPQLSPPQLGSQYMHPPASNGQQYHSSGSPLSPVQYPHGGDGAGYNENTPGSQRLHPSAASPGMSGSQDYASPVTPPGKAASASPRARSGTADNSNTYGNPPVPPPRSSSNNKAQAHISPQEASSRQGKRRENGRNRGDSQQRAKDDMSPPSNKPRRKTPHSPEGPQRAASTREPRDYSSVGALESRSEAAMGPSSIPTGPVHEPSVVLDRMIVTNPDIDIARAQQRQENVHIDARHAAAAGYPDEGDPQEDEDEGANIPKSRHDTSSGKRKETSFGDYILGQTLGEGEFGKVRLGWKRDGSVQVAIKLIRRETLGTNPGRLPKINREISVLKKLSHPNIVRIHEIVHTDRHIGIILEYASGGELFDYILNHRYLKDNAARRLFAQLVSGVGYLHKMGIVHRDLKLENLLLDRNRNIIITDFGFANTFNPSDELSEEIEYNLTNRDFVKQMRLDRTDANGLRRGDLMQTSCGSPCYAAPELVVSDSLYTGRKVDVWSCGVILYAMLAGYLPFDDDPANPDGDNINLLYKYIVTTPLTFPEYVTPHARDLLRRILVPDPRKRADLFEVARHSWLAEYASVVSHITSNTTDVADIANTTVPSEEEKRDTPLLERSASVREPPKPHHVQNNTTVLGGLTQQPGQVSQTPEEKPKRTRDAKRRTVQVEYVAPQSSTTRGGSTPDQQISPGQPSSAAPVQAPTAAPAVARTSAASTGAIRGEPQLDKPLPKPVIDRNRERMGYTNNYADRNQGRPQTGGSMASAGRMESRMPSRGSYSQPVAPAVAATNVQGKLAQPKNGKAYNISGPIPASHGQISASVGHPTTVSGAPTGPAQQPPKSHKRSSTVTSISEKLFGRPASSIFGGKSSTPGSPRLKQGGKRYPPTSMKDPYASMDEPRVSVDSRRSISHAFRRQSDAHNVARPRRFSLLPSFSKFSSNKEQQGAEEPSPANVDDFLYSQQAEQQPQQPQRERRLSTAPAAVPADTHAAINDQESDMYKDRVSVSRDHQIDAMNLSAQIDRQFANLHSSREGQINNAFDPTYPQTHNCDDQMFGIASSSQPLEQQGYHDAQSQGFDQDHQPPQQYDHQFENGSRPSMQAGRAPRSNVLQKGHRKFADAYEFEQTPSHTSGSSGAARKVMDFFRRRGKARAGEER